MSRLLLTCLLLGTWSFVAAAETATSPTSGTRYVAKIKFLRVFQDKQTVSIDTEVAGTKGTPLKTDLAGPKGMVLKLDIRDITGKGPTMYLAEFRLIEVKKDGKEYVLNHPRIVTVVGHPAKLRVGEEGKDRIEVDLIVKEVAVVNHDVPVLTAKDLSIRKQPQVPTASTYGTSLDTVAPAMVGADEKVGRDLAKRDGVRLKRTSARAGLPARLAVAAGR